jgi:predicted transposase/invertase (TIGR01784 family)
MKRDSLLYRFFKELPGCFFQLIGRPEADAKRYDLDSIEYKETAVRLDGVFQPRQADVDPAYLWEAQFYASDKVSANIMSKIGRFLEHGDPNQDWVAVVIYPNRSLEQKNLRPYRWLINSDQLLRIYLDELPPAAPNDFELGALQLIAASKPEIALEKAKAMLPTIRTSKRPSNFKRMMIEFVETVVVYQFPQMSRKEIEKMLRVDDVRQTRVFQEGREEGKEEGREEGKIEGRQEGKEEGRQIGREETVERLARAGMFDLNRPIEEIVKATELTPAQIRKLKKKLQIR